MILPDRLAVQPWMGASATRRVIAALEAAGGEARFVGGCVRNALIGRPIDDIDIATTLVPERAVQALADAGLKSVPTGIAHGTVTAISEGRPFEVTTLRRDVETDGRRAVVAFTEDWAQDAQRRDFRLNALYMDAEGRLYDPVGEGIADALAGRIVFVGDAETRIREDYLRILRFFRFRAWYGAGLEDAAALEACAALKGGLRRLSAERVSKELLKLLGAEDPTFVLESMILTGVLAEVLPRHRSLSILGGLVRIERELLGQADAELRLAALMPQSPAYAMLESGRLRLSKAQRDRLAAAVAPEPPITAGMPQAAMRRMIYEAGAQPFRDRLILAWAADPWTDTRRWRSLLAQAEAFTPPKFPLTGQDAARAGFKPGPAIGQALREIEALWVQNDFLLSRDQLLQRLRTSD